jgi:exodeoxyribonuclease VII large subunit
MADEERTWGLLPMAEPAPRVLRVAELNRIARFALEDRFPDLWVEGELNDVSRPASGHVYFTLCDADPPAQVRGVMYRSDARRTRAKLENGVRVRLRCSLTIYEPRGSFQVIARIALPAGDGDRAAQVARIRQKLAAEGLLDPARKRPLPRVPRVIGVVTSRDGAAIHDVIRVAHARYPVRIVLAHCQVQGPDAPQSIVAAIRSIQRLPDLDVVLVVRGGGAAEDLSAYDDESVVRAVAECRVPTVSGVGHEIDVTLVDLVADVRAATPSNAAEIAVPDRNQLRAEIEHLERALARQFDQRIQRERLKIERLLRRLPDPRRRLGPARQSLASLRAALERAIARRIGEARRELERWRTQLAVHDPQARLSRDRARLRGFGDRLERAMRDFIARERQMVRDLERALVGRGPAVTGARRAELTALAAKLEVLSPLAILARGYAIVLHVPSGRALVRARDAAAGDHVRVRLHRGTLDAVVERVQPEEAA